MRVKKKTQDTERRIGAALAPTRANASRFDFSRVLYILTFATQKLNLIFDPLRGVDRFLCCNEKREYLLPFLDYFFTPERYETN